MAVFRVTLPYHSVLAYSQEVGNRLKHFFLFFFIFCFPDSKPKYGKDKSYSGGLPYGSFNPLQGMAQTPVLVQTPYGYMLASQPSMTSYSYSLPSQDAAGGSTTNPLTNLIAQYIANAQAKKAAAAKLAPKPALTPAQILALIHAVKAAKASSTSPGTGNPTTDEAAPLIAKIKEIIAIHEAAEAKTKASADSSSK